MNDNEHEYNPYPRHEKRTIKRDGATVIQGRYLSDPSQTWHDLAVMEDA